MELLQEAGFHPLEVIRGATLHAAETLAKPKTKNGEEVDFGVVRSGALADMLIVDQNPLENLKVLYGTGWFRLNDATRKVDQIGGVKYTIKDGIVYDAKKLLADVAKMVEDSKRKTNAADKAGQK
jgi:imidazolonepropionase-like amidohydrolase